MSRRKKESEMSEIDQSSTAESHEDGPQLEVLFMDSEGGPPPHEYTCALGAALCNDDESLLMKVLDSQDIDPWDVSFVEDGLGVDSDDKKNMICFAAEKGSWDCVAELVARYMDCGRDQLIMIVLAGTVLEYEMGDDPDRVEWLEQFMRAINFGTAVHQFAKAGHVAMAQPGYAGAFPKANRFIANDFAAIKFSKGKLGTIAAKRIDLRQNALLAIGVGKSRQLAAVLDAMKANALAQQSLSRKPQEPLSEDELGVLTNAALACDYPECLNVILAKYIEFEKSDSLVKAAPKKIDKEDLDTYKRIDAGKLLKKVLFFAHLADSYWTSTTGKPASSTEKAIGEALFSLLSKAEDSGLIVFVKNLCEESFTVLKPCLEMACAQAQSFKEKQDIVDFIAANDESVELPPKRASVRL